MLKVVCMGISTLDIFVAPVSAQTLQIQKTRVREIGLAPGGDAANQAIMLARLGCEPVLISRIGNDESGAYVLNRLQEHGVNISHIVRDDERPTAAAVVLIDTQGERHILSAAGAHAHLCQADVNMQAIRAAQALSICSLFSLPILEDNGLVEILRDVGIQPAVASDLIIPRADHIKYLFARYAVFDMRGAQIEQVGDLSVAWPGMARGGNDYIPPVGIGKDDGAYARKG